MFVLLPSVPQSFVQSSLGTRLVSNGPIPGVVRGPSVRFLLRFFGFSGLSFSLFGRVAAGHKDKHYPTLSSERFLYLGLRIQRLEEKNQTLGEKEDGSSGKKNGEVE